MKFYMHLNRKAFRFLCEFTMVAAKKALEIPQFRFVG